MANIIEFINEYNGQLDIGTTPENTGQCVGLIEKWLQNLGSPVVWGNACDLLANADRNAFEVIPNSPTAYPVSGDIICWAAGWGGSAVGHTAIVTDANVNDFMVFEQNDRIGGGVGACRLHWFANYSGVQGWMRPKALHPAPVPPPPAPPPANPPIPSPTTSTSTSTTTVAPSTTSTTSTTTLPPVLQPPIPSPHLSFWQRLLQALRRWFKS